MSSNLKKKVSHILREDDSKDFNSISIKIASPDDILAWSHGEVTKSETINYRSNKPEPKGLFCQAIFGPVKDYECHCGTYRNNKQYRGQICPQCGVEITKKSVRRERMGHIELASPCVHVWYVKTLPSRIATVLGLTTKEVDSIVGLNTYVVTDAGDNDPNVLMDGDLISEADLDKNNEKVSIGELKPFEAKSGGEAILHMLKKYSLDDDGSEDSIVKKIAELEEELANCRSVSKSQALNKRLMLLRSFKNSQIKPEWMVLTRLPVLPPDLRPLVPLDGGRFAASDLNELYRKIIIRNESLKKQLNEYSSTPEILLRQSKRLLQVAVDNLIENRNKQAATSGAGSKRPLKSLADYIKGKKGRFRQNLLGKRVDYSGRSVISVGPYLQLHQCGLPKQMAKELFKPFILNKLIESEKSDSIKNARKVFDRNDKEVWDALDEVIKQHPVLLNRAPTLHRLGIQAFEPVLIEGKVIQLHPLVCSAFNADFDGDQMAVHVPLTLEAQLEARVLMMANNNILSPASGEAIIVPSQDMVLGSYYMTRDLINVKGEGSIFPSCKHVEIAYQNDEVDIHAKVKVRITRKVTEKDIEANNALVRDLEAKGENASYQKFVVIKDNNEEYNDNGQKYITVSQIVDTTVGRAILWQICPPELDFNLVNKPIGKKEIATILNICYRQLGNDATVKLADDIMFTGFKYAAISGCSIGIEDMVIPPEKASILAKAEAEVNSLAGSRHGTVSADEIKNRKIDIWTRAGDEIKSKMIEAMAKEKLPDQDGNLVEQASMNSLQLMTQSGARGSVENVKQISGMRGLMVRPDGTIIDTPIKSNFREGLNVQEYFISTHGARKGLTDIALKTANSGYLTRRLVDVAQDVIISEDDCGTDKALRVTAVIEGSEMKLRLSDRILGRVLAKDIKVVNDGKETVLLKRNQLITEKEAKLIEDKNIEAVYIRSPTLCEAKNGICVHCYGLDLARNQLITEGEAVGIIAAQSIGEPGTQLTMRTIHSGGIAKGGSTNTEALSKTNGTVHIDTAKSVIDKYGNVVITDQKAFVRIKDTEGRLCENYRVPYGTKLNIKDGQDIKQGDCLASWDESVKPIINEVDGYVKFVDMIDGNQGTIIVKIDKTTGFTNTTVVEQQRRSKLYQDHKPKIIIVDANGEPLTLKNGSKAEYNLPDKARVLVLDGEKVPVGTILATTTIFKQSSNDITGGLPRVADLFEARKPKDPAVLAEISGIVSFGKDTKDKERLIITPQMEEGDEIPKPFEVLIPKHRLINVNAGEEVKKGDILVNGPEAAEDILRLKGVEELTHYIVDEVQQVYRQQSVKIADKHIEVIVRQMLRQVEIVNPAPVGDKNDYQEGQIVSFSKVSKENQLRRKLNYPEITFKRKLLGLTKASLSNDSFISAASFQETTKVLVEAAIQNKKDELKGLKENVVIGRLIPAGTGYRAHKEQCLTSIKNRITKSTGAGTSLR